MVDLDDDMCVRIPELGRAAERILTGFDMSGEPCFESSSGPITLTHLLSGTSGFGPDYDPLVHQWKVSTSTGVNSCLKVGVGFGDGANACRSTSSTFRLSPSRARSISMLQMPSTRPLSCTVHSIDSWTAGSHTLSPPLPGVTLQVGFRNTSATHLAWSTRRSIRSTRKEAHVGCPLAGSQTDRMEP